MAKCRLTGKQRMVGNKVSHSNIKNKKVFKANIQSKRFYLPEEGRWIRMKVSTRALRSITKDGLRAYVKKHRISL